MNIYRTEFFAFCPVNGVRVKYALRIETTEVIKVEQIINEVCMHSDGYHEEIADDLFRAFGGRQTLLAEHHGVTIETVRGANDCAWCHGSGMADATGHGDLERCDRCSAAHQQQISTARRCSAEEAGSNAGAMPNAPASPAAGNRWVCCDGCTTRPICQRQAMCIDSGTAAPAQRTVREFTNEMGNRIRITIEGPASTAENVLTPMEASELRQALNALGVIASPDEQKGGA